MPHANHTKQVQLETLNPLDDVPMLCELGNVWVVLFLLFTNGLSLNVIFVNNCHIMLVVVSLRPI